MSTGNRENLFHAALVKVHDLARNFPINENTMREILQTVDDVLEQSRVLDEAEHAALGGGE